MYASGNMRKNHRCYSHSLHVISDLRISFHILSLILPILSSTLFTTDVDYSSLFLLISHIMMKVHFTTLLFAVPMRFYSRGNVVTIIPQKKFTVRNLNNDTTKWGCIVMTWTWHGHVIYYIVFFSNRTNLLCQTARSMMSEHIVERIDILIFVWMQQDFQYALHI